MPDHALCAGAYQVASRDGSGEFNNERGTCMMRQRELFALGAIFISSAVLASGPASPKAKVSLIPFSSAVAADQPIEIGVGYELEPGWHIYWQNSGDAGSAPTVKWSLPEGFTAGELQFPAPKRHVSPGDIVTNILAGEPILLTTIHPPKTLPPGEITIAANLVTFVCEGQCLQEKGNVELKLPVVASAGEVKPANESLLSQAKRKLPKTASKVVSISPVIASPQVTPGSKFEIEVKANITKGYHIQSNKPSVPSLIPAEIFLHRIAGVRYEKPKFPDGKIRKDKHLGELSEFGGEITVRVPAEIDAEREPGPLKIAGVFSYQACEDNGNCLPPEAVGFSVPVEVVAGTVKAATPALAENPGVGVSSEPTAALTAAPVELAESVTPQATGIDGFLKRFGLAGLLLGCFLYGLFINATPCVLPLLSIKVLGFVQQAHESRKKTMALGLAFGAGVIVFFVALGLLAAKGSNILHYPLAVIILGAVVLAMSLSMLGVYTLHVPTSATSLEASIHQEGPAASFAKGALAPVLGFACTGPLLAGIFGWATQQPREVAILAFSFAGLGMASPYMLLGANPGWLSFLPRPGMWMITFERIMGFLLLAMVIWLVHPLTAQIGVVGLELTFVFYVAVAMACWVLGKIQITMPSIERWKYRLASVLVVLVSSAIVYGWVYPIDQALIAMKSNRNCLMACENGEIPTAASDQVVWRSWSPEAVKEAVSEGKLAFVDFTAAYCTVCKVNKKVAIDTPEVRQVLSDPNVAAFRGDFTTGDDAIADVLQKFSRAGVPLNLIYPPGRPDRPLVLETNLTTSYLLQKLDEAQAITSQSASIAGPQ